MLGEEQAVWKTTAREVHDGRGRGNEKDIHYRVEREKYDTILGTKKTD